MNKIPISLKWGCNSVGTMPENYLILGQKSLISINFMIMDDKILIDEEVALRNVCQRQSIISVKAKSKESDAYEGKKEKVSDIKVECEMDIN
jgi:hypothetical protein